MGWKMGNEIWGVCAEPVGNGSTWRTRKAMGLAELIKTRAEVEGLSSES